MFNHRVLHVDWRPLFVGYLLCVVVSSVEATFATKSEGHTVARKSHGTVAAVDRPVRRQGFSVTHDLATLTKMLRDESQRRRMQRAKSFFAALHKRHLLLKQLLSVELPAKKMNARRM